MTKKVHYQTEIHIDIFSDIENESSKLIATILRNVWPETYLSDLNIEEYISFITELWIKNYITSPQTKEAIERIKQANPPEDLKIYLVFNLFDNEDNLIITEEEIMISPLFRVYLPTKDLWDTYAYDSKIKKFQSLEIIEPAYVEEIKLSMSEIEKSKFDDLLIQAYSFHNRLLGITAKKILLYTAQPPERISEWNKKGIIPKGIYFTNKMSRAEYYFETGDVIVDYRLPEDKIVQTSEFGSAKEYVTIENIPIK